MALTVTATACSDRASSDSKSKKAPEAAAAVPTTFVNESASKAATPAPAGPVTFADGESAFQTRNYGEATRIFAVCSWLSSKVGTRFSVRSSG